ncbi:ecto-ADP-ribosyltransferase 5-like [Pygocentrus nattereri]|uniref:NAD(P)(+)--arginine ADP-ribosyltransferase n=1 Tax=Pygocentrus nattereri TaxID=42514 RepID=A0A3B4D020_PYGNA|nr:ecto-ADP-ribosyltransferase 5-like [Pygocentrus nattereri]
MIMKMLHSTAMMRLFILLILAVHTAAAITMSLYPNSVDEEFEFEDCKKEMYRRITNHSLNEELNNNAKFKKAWDEAKKDLILGRKENSNLTQDELRKIALRVYTGTDVYRELNDKMREGRGTYKTGFGLISLHFLITDGIQTRNAEQHLQRDCRTTYRRTNITIEITDPFVRFGSFASSSVKTTLTHFGNETCFIITTCYGADISMKSKYDQEVEVLIPPYEVFINETVTANKAPNCTRVYQLRSVGKISTMK